MTGDLSVPAPQPNPSTDDDFAAVDRYIAGREDASGIADELVRRYGGSGRAVELPGTLGGDDRLPADDDAVPIVPSARVDLDLDQIEARLASDRLVSPVLDVLVREDVPRLVAEVRRLREENAELRRGVGLSLGEPTWGQLREKVVAQAEAIRVAGDLADHYKAQRDATGDFLAASRAEAARVREALQAERKHHMAVWRECVLDGEVWPCATVRALDAALDGSE